VTTGRLSAFIDALVAGRRPARFRADPDDAPMLRTAIELRAARPGDAQPSEQFVSDLFEKLSDQSAPAAPDQRPARKHRARLALVAAAAGAVLVSGTVAVTDAFDHPSGTPSAVQAPHGDVLRTGTFVASDSRVLGQIVAYRGQPSWVFMNVTVPQYNGPITCELQAADGSVVSFGTFQIHNGIGHFSKTIRVDVSALRGARLVTSTGQPVASATFA
jgi:hypothetical protein